MSTMQHPGKLQPEKSSVARWVIPPPARRSVKNTKSNPTRQTTIVPNGSDLDYSENQNRSNVTNGSNPEPSPSNPSPLSSMSSPNGSPKDAPINLANCKTIYVFIEAHLKELIEHQKMIDVARTKLFANRNNILGLQADSSDVAYIALNDITKLKVRDQQTKAIETVKQLNRYLKDLSIIGNGDEGSQQVDEGVINLISDIRSEIINALNDFVISNSDIQVPIIEHVELDRFEYDLCIDAQNSPKLHNSPTANPMLNSSLVNSAINAHNQNRKRYENSYHQSHVPSGRSGSVTRSFDQSILVISHNDGVPEAHQQQQLDYCAQTMDLEKRRRDIQKLERDSHELRNLFSDFHSLVKQQGESLDTIEDNIMMAAEHMREGQHHLNRVQKSLGVIVPVTGCMVGALVGGPIGLIIGGKLSGISIVCASSLVGLISSFGAQRCLFPVKIKGH